MKIDTERAMEESQPRFGLDLLETMYLRLTPVVMTCGPQILRCPLLSISSIAIPANANQFQGDITQLERLREKMHKQRDYVFLNIDALE